MELNISSWSNKLICLSGSLNDLMIALPCRRELMCCVLNSLPDHILIKPVCQKWCQYSTDYYIIVFSMNRMNQLRT